MGFPKKRSTDRPVVYLRLGGRWHRFRDDADASVGGWSQIWASYLLQTLEAWGLWGRGRRSPGPSHRNKEERKYKQRALRKEEARGARRGDDALQQLEG